MANGILSAKLCEMDSQLTDLHSKIMLSEQLSDERLDEEITALRLNVEDQSKLIMEGISKTKLKLADSLVSKFEMIKKELMEMDCCEADSEYAILAAEYDLDFAMLVAKHSLLMSLEAIKADRESQGK